MQNNVTFFYSILLFLFERNLYKEVVHSVCIISDARERELRSKNKNALLSVYIRLRKEIDIAFVRAVDILQNLRFHRSCRRTCYFGRLRNWFP